MERKMINKLTIIMSFFILIAQNEALSMNREIIKTPTFEEIIKQSILIVPSNTKMIELPYTIANKEKANDVLSDQKPLVFKASKQATAKPPIIYLDLTNSDDVQNQNPQVDCYPKHISVNNYSNIQINYSPEVSTMNNFSNQKENNPSNDVSWKNSTKNKTNFHFNDGLLNPNGHQNRSMNNNYHFDNSNINYNANHDEKRKRDDLERLEIAEILESLKTAVNDENHNNQNVGNGKKRKIVQQFSTQNNN